MKNIIFALLLLLPAASFANESEGFNWTVTVKGGADHITKTFNSRSNIYLGEFAKMNCTLTVKSVKTDKSLGVYQKGFVSCATPDDQYFVSGVDVRQKSQKASDGVVITIQNDIEAYSFSLNSAD